MLITMKSILSGIERTKDLAVTKEQYDNWAVKGMLIQQAMPDLQPSEREFILTGISEEEWDETFKDEEEN